VHTEFSCQQNWSGVSACFVCQAQASPCKAKFLAFPLITSAQTLAADEENWFKS